MIYKINFKYLILRFAKCNRTYSSISILSSHAFVADKICIKISFKPILYNKYKLILNYNLASTAASTLSAKPVTYPISGRFKIDMEIFDESNLPMEKWKSIIEEQQSTNNRFSQPVFDSFVIIECLKKSNMMLAISYVNYIETNKQTLNFLALSHFLLLLSENIKDIDKNLFLKVYDELKMKKDLPIQIIENIIKALCNTHMWPDSYVYLNELLNIAPNDILIARAHNYLISAISRNKDMNSVFDYLKSLEAQMGSLKTDFNLNEDTIITLLQKINHDSEECLMTLFRYLQKCETVFSENCADFLSSMKLNKWTSQRTKIGSRKKCTHCGGHLEKITLDIETVNKLKEACEDNALRGSDIFQSTTPKEWNDYCVFLKENGPFKIVVDGLNVMYMNNNSNKYALTNELIRRFSGKPNSGKILIVIRNHFKKKFIKVFGALDAIPNAKFYFLDNLTKDDAFIIYAALYSGIGTKFVTKDYLRNHKFVIGDLLLRKQFMKWQNLHQILIDFDRGKMIMKQPNPYHRIPQWNGETRAWHIPIDTEDERTYIESCEEWLCLRRTQNKENT